MINQISVFVENKPGRAKEVLTALANAAIDIKALSLADTTEFGIIRMIVSDTETAKKVLTEDGVTVRVGKVTIISIPDEPGALLKAFEILGDGGVNVEYTYAFGEKYEGASVITIKTDDIEKGEKVLTNGKIRVLDQAEIEKI